MRVFFLTVAVSIFLCGGLRAQSGWIMQPAGVTGDLVAVFFTSSDNGWIAGDGGYLASTMDGGGRWNKYPLNTTEDINEIYFRNDDNGYLVAGRKMFITSDKGRTWHEIKPYRSGDFGTGQPEFNSIRFTDKKRGYIVGSVTKGDIVVDSLLMRTDDGGDTWRRIQLPDKGELIHLVFRGNQRGWIVGANGLILATTDDGLTWTKQQSGLVNTLYNVDFSDNDNGYAVGEKGTVLRTENGGAAWTKADSGVRTTLLRVDFADSKNGWIVGRGGVILRSGDRGLTWIKQESSTINSLFGLYMDKKFGWAVGAKGTVLKYKK